jgi:hypothetical protein
VTARITAALVALTVAPLTAGAQAPTVQIAGFLDGYYAWDAGKPENHDRAFTTQAVRHNEFNINLAHIGLVLSGERVRGRVALQAGTAVQANYAGEPTQGAISGPTLSRHIQEAVAGIRVSPRLWVDAGVFFSHIGQESWISRDNPTYTRSFTADYTPYYSTGVKGTWTPSDQVTAQLHVVNGWQVISDQNAGKGVGARIDWSPSSTMTVGVNGYVGNEQPEGAEARSRRFGQLTALLRPTAALGVWLTADAGTQESPDDEDDTWWSATAIGELRLTDAASAALRVERFVDRQGVLTGAANFDVTSASVGLNVRLPEGALWRSEWRWYRSDDARWPDPDGLRERTTLLVTSLALTL